jgi:hypothetical protein
MERDRKLLAQQPIPNQSITGGCNG